MALGCEGVSWLAEVGEDCALDMIAARARSEYWRDPFRTGVRPAPVDCEEGRAPPSRDIQCQLELLQ